MAPLPILQILLSAVIAYCAVKNLKSKKIQNVLIYHQPEK